MKRALLTFMLLLLGSALALAQVCPHAFSLLGLEKNLDAEYSLSHNLPGKKERVAAQVALLNRAFFPMMLELNAGITKLSAREISDLLGNLKQKFPIERSRYESSWPARVKFDKANTYIESNSTSATRYYGMATDKMAYRRDKFLYIEGDPERVKELGLVHHMFGTVLTPVGEYGEKFAEDMLRTTQVMMEIADKNLSGISKEIYESSPNLLADGATRVKNAHVEYAQIQQTPKSAALEGILSFHQLVNMVAGQKIPGLETGDDVIRAIVKGGHGNLGLTSELTMHYPMALVGPSTNAGYGFRNALEMKDGKLQMTAAFKAKTLELKKGIEKFGVRGVCPMASYWRKPAAEGQAAADRHRMTGLQHMAEDFLKIYEVVSKSGK